MGLDQEKAMFEAMVMQPSGPAYVMYRDALDCFWQPEKMGLFDMDRMSYMALPPAQKRLMRLNLWFFLFADQMVIDQIEDGLRPLLKADAFHSGLGMDGVQSFLLLQSLMENIHRQAYRNMWSGVLPPEDQHMDHFETMPGVRRILEHMKRYVKADLSLAERIFGWLLVEGLFFQNTFAALFWFQSSKFPATIAGNELISRDENLHTNFSALLYVFLKKKLSSERVRELVEEFMAVNDEYNADLLPEPLIGLTRADLDQYARFRCDRLLVLIGEQTIYRVKNPLPHMENFGLMCLTNFFDVTETNYTHGDESRTPSIRSSAKDGLAGSASSSDWDAESAFFGDINDL